MATLSIRNLDETLKQQLRVQAALHGRSMEAEARTILGDALTAKASDANLAQRIRRRFEPLGGVELPMEKSQPVREFPLSGE